MKTHLTEKPEEKKQQRAAAHRTNQISQRKSISLQDNRTNTSIIQKMEVAQLVAIRNIKGVIFNGQGSVLRRLLLGQVPNGTNVIVTQTDHVGGSFNVKFSRAKGKITKKEAQRWIENAIPESSSDESGSDSE